MVYHLLDRCVLLLILCGAYDSLVARPEGAFPVMSLSRQPLLLTRMRQNLTPRTSGSQASVMTSASAREWLTKHSCRSPAPADYQQRNADFAIRAREEIPVAAGVTEELFLHWVFAISAF
mmetsp:Transcript_49304/g.77985  ORF Transcript_49304/g.77985 Transcript_49304/m.77985 type:complete len:120 (+) Transcript_49304:61-420(+)